MFSFLGNLKRRCKILSLVRERIAPGLLVRAKLIGADGGEGKHAEQRQFAHQQFHAVAIHQHHQRMDIALLFFEQNSLRGAGSAQCHQAERRRGDAKCHADDRQQKIKRIERFWL